MLTHRGLVVPYGAGKSQDYIYGTWKYKLFGWTVAWAATGVRTHAAMILLVSCPALKPTAQKEYSGGQPARVSTGVCQSTKIIFKLLR